ncbi:MAG: phosphatase PAP2 family protein, partial [Rhodoferax sp.]|nr:phosphatase PAP2 family protein [Rhodoferax sp.]
MPATAPLPPSSDTDSTPPLLVWIGLAFLLVALIPTAWSSLDLRSAALFGTPDATRQVGNWWWVKTINDYVPSVFRFFLLLAFLGWLAGLLQPRWRAMRLPLAFVVLAGILGPGLVVNWGFKDQWQRARPYQVEDLGGKLKFTRAALMTDQCQDNCSFVSGHVACGVFLVSIGLVHRRRQRHWAVLGVLSGLLIGFARMADSAH